MGNPGELIEIDQIINAVEFGGIFLVYMIPVTAVVIFVAILVRQYKKKKKLKQQRKFEEKNRKAIEKENKKENKKAIKHKTLIDNDEEDLEKLNDIEQEPINKEKFESLALEFDEEGHVM